MDREFPVVIAPLAELSISAYNPESASFLHAVDRLQRKKLQLFAIHAFASYPAERKNGLAETTSDEQQKGWLTGLEPATSRSTI